MATNKKKVLYTDSMGKAGVQILKERGDIEAVAFAYAGHDVTMVDVKDGRSAQDFAKLETEALNEVGKTFTSLSRFGLLKESEADALMARVAVVPGVDFGSDAHVRMS